MSMKTNVRNADMIKSGRMKMTKRREYLEARNREIAVWSSPITYLLQIVAVLSLPV